MTKVLAVLRELQLAGPRGVHGFDLKASGGDRYAARILDVKKLGYIVTSVPERRGRALGVRYYLNAFSTKTSQGRQEATTQVVESYKEPLFSHPFTRPVQMPEAWLQLKDKLRHRPSSTTFYEAGSGQRNLQSDTYVSPVSFQENIKGISGSEIL